VKAEERCSLRGTGERSGEEVACKMWSTSMSTDRARSSRFSGDEDAVLGGKSSGIKAGSGGVDTGTLAGAAASSERVDRRLNDRTTPFVLDWLHPPVSKTV